jgi:hypothetical protein
MIKTIKKYLLLRKKLLHENETNKNTNSNDSVSNKIKMDSPDDLVRNDD